MFDVRNPTRNGHFGAFGGAYVPETLWAPVKQVEAAFMGAIADPSFLHELGEELRSFVGRPTALTRATRLEAAWGARGPIAFKREDLAHTGAHKINNSMGQVMLARRMGRTRIIAETGAGQHGVATATACARLGMSCVVYMGAVDMQRQALNVYRMRVLGAEVRAVESGSRTLKDAINEAMRDWAGDPDRSYYCIGSALGPHPWPWMVRFFQSVIGKEARAQWLERFGSLPDAVVACIGGGSNAIGVFSAFLDDTDVALHGAEAGGHGTGLGQHAARFAGGQPGVLHGTRTWLLQDADGQVLPTDSISAGLDYPAIGPEHAMLQASGRARYDAVRDEEALAAFRELARMEGLLAALESAHGVALAKRLVAEGAIGEGGVLINLSGRGDKDMETVRALDGAGGAA